MTQFDLFAARAERDRALTQVSDNADLSWKARAELVLLRVATTLDEFTSEDIWRAGLTHPREPRALGAVMSTAAKRGLIEKTGRYVATAMVSRHSAPIAVWRRRLP